MIHKECFFGPKKMCFMQTESVLQTKNRSGPAKNRFSVALTLIYLPQFMVLFTHQKTNLSSKKTFIILTLPSV